MPAESAQGEIVAKDAAPSQKSTSAILRMKLVGAKSSPVVSGQNELPGKANYFTGSDPKKWRTDLPTYAKVRYEEVYPGIDLIYYGNQRQLEYDFVVAPGADPARIQLGFDGAQKIRVDARGDLLVETTGGSVRWQKPVVYQESNGVRKMVEGKYLLRRRHQVSFEVAAYDATKPLIIDPTLLYSTYLGGSNAEQGSAIAVDSSGNAYVTGVTGSVDFPTTTGAFQTTFAGGNGDVFVTKLNPTGSGLVYSTYLGGGGQDWGLGIAVDTAGNAYVTGLTSSTDFPTTPGAIQTVKGGGQDGFISKLDPTGSALVYSTYLGGNGLDQGNAIALDSLGNAYVTGFTTSTNFPTTFGAFQTTNAGGRDAFVSKLDPTGTTLVYSTYLGGAQTESGNGIAVDSSGNAYVTGQTSSNDFPTTLLAFQTSKAGANEAFISKLDPTGTTLVYSTYLGGGGQDIGNGIAVDSSGNAYVTGLTTSTNFPTTFGAFQTTYAGGQDAFVTKLDPTGTTLVYSTYLGGNSTESGNGIAVDALGDAFVTGFTFSGNFPTTTGAFQTSWAGGSDAYFTTLNASGTGLLYSTYLGGGANDQGKGIAVDASGNAYVTGFTTSTNFPTTPGAFQTAQPGFQNAFVAKFGGFPLPAPTFPFVIGDRNAVVGNHVTFWGAQWAKQNSLSGGRAPSSFKGFANSPNPNPPACGGTWKSDPANSSNPPDSVPSLINVIAASSITKSGSTITGNVFEIVTIQVDPGYAPDPGNAGTGTVVAIVCQ